MDTIVNKQDNKGSVEIAKQFLEVKGEAVFITNRMGYGEFVTMVKREIGIDLNDTNTNLEDKYYLYLDKVTLEQMTRAIIMYLEQGVMNFFVDDTYNTILTHEAFRDDIISLEKNKIFFTVTDNNKIIK